MIQSGDSRKEVLSGVPVKADEVVDVRDCVQVHEIVPALYGLGNFITQENASRNYIAIPMTILRELEGYDFLFSCDLIYETADSSLLSTDGTSLDMERYFNAFVLVDIDGTSFQVELNPHGWKAQEENGLYRLTLSATIEFPSSSNQLELRYRMQNFDSKLRDFLSGGDFSFSLTARAKEVGE